MLDHATTKVLTRVKPGERFGYRSTSKDEWIHECIADPKDGEPPVTVFPRALS